MRDVTRKAKGAAYSPQSFDHLKGLVGLSDAQLAEHLDLYEGYVKQVNALVHELAEMRGERRASKEGRGLADATRRLAFEYDGMVLHEFYFANPEAGRRGSTVRPTAARPRPRRRSDRSTRGWRTSKRSAAFEASAGSSCSRILTDRLINQSVSLHQEGLLARCKPLLVMDVWEHAFMRDYKAAERAKYVGAFFKNIDWSVVEGRLNESTAMSSPSAA